MQQSSSLTAKFFKVFITSISGKSAKVELGEAVASRI